jgi:2-methylcitrate dehydratase PrpD
MTIAQRIGAFAADLRYDQLPDEVVKRAKLLILDALGIGLASSTFPFAARARTATALLAGEAPGEATAIGASHVLPLRDAVGLNGVLVHGLDFDDTHPAGVVHASASALPTALGLCEVLGGSGRDLLLGFVAGLEVTCRLGMAAGGSLHASGFHPTGVVGAFGAAVAAGRLRKLDGETIAAAQGIVGSMASGSLEFLSTGAWTKRLHPGWAAQCGITATAWAEAGFEAPPKVYEGRYGLYRTHVDPSQPVDLDLCTDGLGTRWETMAIAVKPFPACHFTHAFADAALTLRDRHGIKAGDVASVVCLIADGEIPVVCEPEANKQAPRSAYDAQFSLPYVVAACLERGQFTLDELDESILSDPSILDLARRVSYEADPRSGYPVLFSGEVRLRLHDGREVRHREQVNRGAQDRPLTTADIVSKYRANAQRALTSDHVDLLVEEVLRLDELDSLAPLLALLRS